MSPALSFYNDALNNLVLRDQLNKLTDTLRSREYTIGELQKSNEVLRRVLNRPQPVPQPVPQPDDRIYMVCEVFGTETRYHPATKAELDIHTGVVNLYARIDELIRQRCELETRNRELTLQLEDWKRAHWEGPL